MSAPGGGWFPDPTGRHQHRYWNGTSWTGQVADQGQVSIDPPQMPPLADLPVAVPVSPPAAPPSSPPPPPVTYTPNPGQPAPPPPPPPANYTPTGVAAPVPGYAPAPPTAQGGTVAWMSVVGALIAGLSAPLDWLDTGFGGANGFDVPAAFLVDKSTGGDSAFSVGLLVLVLAAAALVAGFAHSPGSRVVGRIAGGLLVAVGVMFAFQLYNLADDVGAKVTDLIGFAPLLAVVGGGMIGATPKRAPRT